VQASQIFFWTLDTKAHSAFLHCEHERGLVTQFGVLLLCAADDMPVLMLRPLLLALLQRQS
jgi:hypothetical protein